MQGIIMKEDLGVSQTMNKDELKKAIALNVKSLYRKTIDEATPAMIYQAVALAVKDMIIDRWIATHKEYEKQDAKVVYYMSMEFLTGRFLETISSASVSRRKSRRHFLNWALT